MRCTKRKRISLYRLPLYRLLDFAYMTRLIHVPLHVMLLLVTVWELVSCIYDFTSRLHFPALVLHFNFAFVLPSSLWLGFESIAAKPVYRRCGKLARLSLHPSVDFDMLNTELWHKLLAIALTTVTLLLYSVYMDHLTLQFESLGDVPGFTKVAKVMDYVALPAVALLLQIILLLLHLETSNGAKESYLEAWDVRWHPLKGTIVASLLLKALAGVSQLVDIVWIRSQGSSLHPHGSIEFSGFCVLIVVVSILYVAASSDLLINTLLLVVIWILMASGILPLALQPVPKYLLFFFSFSAVELYVVRSGKLFDDNSRKSLLGVWILASATVLSAELISSVV